ncbi:Relaxase/Mobilisation nuclease domain-containing protein [Daejeonella rubra]|uniref:Relaxase/Mobilisation nuclease domain-containing protein n=1 Tax=Daejeonella rubra TaxID=990371 RepID=A0A1G9NKD3_9SPHI|nr:relaxase/mobilization nuclease domain-containing protein [Daejeonella rubra]SDL86839.1 Relaxase/Mobilisation nuclease domain-containing protein [Daejeonella rubra]
MIVKILNKSAAFKGVSYNTSKVEKDKGELMKVQNFGAIQGLDYLRPQDYINYLEAQSARSTRTKFPQFHAVISAEGRSHSKEQLSHIGEQWLTGMGYGDQPYLLIFHKDTKNNHIHMVTTRVGKDGRKIPDAFEKIKSYQVLNRILGVDENRAAKAQVEKALTYSFSTRAQFMMISEAQGYAVTLSATDYKISKFGKELAQIPIKKVDERIADHQKNKERISQLRAIIEKYRLKVNPAIYSITRDLPGGRTKTVSGYSSKLAEMLKAKFGVQILFHAKDDKPPYGYTILDHVGKAVFKGSEVMSLKEFIDPLQPRIKQEASPEFSEIMKEISQDNLAFYEEALNEYSSEGRNPDEFHALNAEPSADQYDTGISVGLPELQIDISDDIDDEAIPGRNRRKKRKSITNNR